MNSKAPPPHSPQIDAEALRERLRDLQTPGVEVEFDPAEAELAGAFIEDALSELDALASAEGLAQEPAFVEGGPYDPPLFLAKTKTL